MATPKAIPTDYATTTRRSSTTSRTGLVSYFGTESDQGSDPFAPSVGAMATQRDRDTAGSDASPLRPGAPQDLRVSQTAARRIELRHLQHFAVLAEELHFTRAAQRLHLVQQSLSASIAQLEAALGVTVFERSSRGVSLTPAGVAFLAKTVDVLAGVDDAVRTAAGFAAGRAGEVTIGLSSTTGLAFTPLLLAELAAAFPDLRVDVRHLGFEDPSGGLLDGTSDVAIIRPPLDAPETDSVEIARESRWVTLPEAHPLAGRTSVSFSEVECEPWMDLRTDPVWCAFWRGDAHRTRPARFGAVCRSVDDLFEAARSGRAVGLVPESVVRSRAVPGLAFVELIDLEECSVVVAVRRGEDRPVSRTVLATAQRLLADRA